MADSAQKLLINMRSLVSRIGCQDAAAEQINTRWDANSSKGLISRKVHGSASWGVLEVIALEDAVGKYPVTQMMIDRLTVDDSAPCACLVKQSGAIAKECGEAISAILAAQQSTKSDDVTKAVIEVDEAIEALKQARARLRKGLK